MDQYGSLETHVLLWAANRVTPGDKRWLWIATEEGSWAWSASDQEWQRWVGGRVTQTMFEEEFRDALVEQCETYELTTYQINHMRS